MSVVVYRAGVIASDSLVADGSLRWCAHRKVGRLPDGTLFGAAGAPRPWRRT